MVIGFGILWGLKNKRWKQAVLLVCLGVVYSIMVLGIIMPALSPTGKHVMLGKELGQLSRYSWLGNSLTNVFKTILFHPISVIKIIVLDMGGATYLLVLFINFFGVSSGSTTIFIAGFGGYDGKYAVGEPHAEKPFCLS